MGAFKIKLKTNPLTKRIYRYLKIEKDTKELNYRIKYTGTFKDRSQNQEYLCILLAGYKEFSYSSVIGRIKKYIPKNIDMCVISSGLYSEQLDKMCEENNWSYLATKQNNVCLVQNVAIAKHPKAKYIFKLDEDIFITQNYFENMLRAYQHAKAGEYNPGVLAPMINVNGFSYAKLLQKYDLIEQFEKLFGPVKIGSGPQKPIEKNPEIAKFMWGGYNNIKSIDEMNKEMGKKELKESACPHRFSIGAILFERKLWEDMGYFSVSKSSTGMGIDEIEIDKYCFLNSKPLMVSENIVVGHLAFGPQNKEMKNYYLDNLKMFEAPKEELPK